MFLFQYFIFFHYICINEIGKSINKPLKLSIMKKLFYLLLALPLVMVACDPDNPEPEPKPEPKPEVKDPVLTLTSAATLDFTAEGGNGTITYTLENAVEGTELEATCEAEWVSNVAVAENVTFVVAANEGEARETKVVVSYGEQSFDVAVKQAAKQGEEPEPEPTEPTELAYLNGSYYEPGYWDPSYDAHNFYIMLSSAEQVSTYEPNSTYLTLDMWASEGDAANPVIPAGEYVFDIEDSSVAGTVGCYYSVLELTDDTATVATEVYPVEGKVVVSADKIEVNFVDAYGDEYAFVYNGTPALPVVEAGNVEFSGGTEYYAEVANYGDYYSVGADNYYFTIVEDAASFSGVYLTFDLLVDPAQGGYAGEYTVLMDTSDVMNKFVPGNISGGYLNGSWYAIVEGGSLTDVYQPLYGGTITITDNADGTTTFTLDCLDDYNNTITGTVTTNVTVEEPNAAALSANRTRGIAASKVIRK